MRNKYNTKESLWRIANTITGDETPSGFSDIAEALSYIADNYGGGENKESRIEKHKNTLGTILTVAETYFNAHYSGEHPFNYRTQCGLFSNKIEENGEFLIQCSGFATACVKGIPFKQSRYYRGANNTNIQKDWGFVSDGTGELANKLPYNPNPYVYDSEPYSDYMLSSGLAKYCDSKGWLSKFDVNRNGLKRGDIIFYANGDTFDDITHTAICVGVDKAGVWIIESQTEGKPLMWLIRTYSSSTLGTLKYFARIPGIETEYTTELVYRDTNNYTGGFPSTTAQATSIKFDTPLPIGFYTLRIEDGGDSERDGAWIMYEGETQTQVPSSRKCYADNRGGVSTLLFYADKPVTQMSIRAIKNNSSTKYDINKIAIYKGYYPD